MKMLHKRLVRGTCEACGETTLVRVRRFESVDAKLQLCVKCVPVDHIDMSHEQRPPKGAIE